MNDFILLINNIWFHIFMVVCVGIGTFQYIVEEYRYTTKSVVEMIFLALLAGLFYPITLGSAAIHKFLSWCYD